MIDAVAAPGGQEGRAMPIRYPSLATRGSRIYGVGSYRPQQVVGNEEIAARTGVTAQWITERSGIQTRRYAGPEETVAAMGQVAAGKALAMAGIDPASTGCVVVATTTHLTQMPALAPEIAHAIGASRAAAFDISAACAGFCHALALASDMVRAGTADYVIVIGTERITDILDRDDKATAFLFADGAGAVVVGPADEPGIGPVEWGSDGSQLATIGMTNMWTPGLRTDPGSPWPRLGMKGWRVYRWATGQLAPVARRAMESAGVIPADLRAFIPHQANLLITRALAKSLELPPDVEVSEDIVHSGNTSAASIPLAMDALLTAGRATHGDLALLVGFGSGLVYAAQVVQLP
jgi:3-oxoacyl-[acyl-carrier-protein] synthase-3